MSDKESFLIIRRVGRDRQVGRREGGIIHHRERLYHSIFETLFTVLSVRTLIKPVVERPKVNVTPGEEHANERNTGVGFMGA
jgi:hypothetical protein